jgi:starch-binding outer membrane protein, SusD/RagB family
LSDNQLSLRCGSFLLLAVGLAGCELKVVNPGPVEDSYLDQEPAHAAMIYGSIRSFNLALAAGDGMSLGRAGACISREWHPTGQTGSFACSLQVLRNQLTPDAAGGPVDRGQQARWLAEHAVSRIQRVRGESFETYELAPLALLFVGYSNRLLGEHVCRTVVDGGPEQSFLIHFGRAEEAFTEALEIARKLKDTQYEYAALAGRASVRIWLGNWPSAVADASGVPKDFKFVTSFNMVDRDQYNSLHTSTAAPPGERRNFTLWHTFYGENFDAFDDPRTPYRKYPDIPFQFGLGRVQDLGDGRGEVGEAPYWQQRKYTTDSAPINLSSGREAMLIVAEAKLRGGDWQGALATVNEIRGEVGVALREAASTEETWTWLKLEKLIELWLEGRAVGERRRWQGAGSDGPTPGPLPELLRMDDRMGKDTCFPISQLEYDTNPNLRNSK